MKSSSALSQCNQCQDHTQWLSPDQLQFLGDDYLVRQFQDIELPDYLVDFIFFVFVIIVIVIHLQCEKELVPPSPLLVESRPVLNHSLLVSCIDIQVLCYGTLLSNN